MQFINPFSSHILYLPSRFLHSTHRKPQNSFISLYFFQHKIIYNKNPRPHNTAAINIIIFYLYARALINLLPLINFGPAKDYFSRISSNLFRLRDEGRPFLVPCRKFGRKYARIPTRWTFPKYYIIFVLTARRSETGARL